MRFLCSHNLKALFGILVFVMVLAPQGRAQTLPATITVNAGTTVTSFAPISVFGNNTAYWIAKSDNLAIQSKVQAAGNYFLRYPGGSSSDDYHWNGAGSYDTNGYWVPDNTSYQPGFVGSETYRGTTSSYGTASNLTDNDNTTIWLSNGDTDFPNSQWAELDLSSSMTVNAVTIVWGNAVSATLPYAVSFQVQSWPTTVGGPPLYNNSPNKWVTVGNFTGTGGTQGVTFPGVMAQYWRILMTASSAGVSGAYSIAEVKLYNGASQVSSNSAAATVQTQAEVSSTDSASGYLKTPDFDFESYMSYVHSFSPYAIPLITVNLGTGSAQEAAAWVHYANGVKGYGIKYWQIGNETEGNWETGGPLPAQDYVRRYVEYFNAMKAADPSIVITGPVSGSFLDTSNMYDGKSYVQDFISMLHADGDDSYIDGIDFHWYPNYGSETSPYSPSSALASTSTLDAYPVSLTSWLSGVSGVSGVSGGATIPVFMSEFNVDPGDVNFQVQLGNGLWVADALGHFVTDFGSRGFSNLWDTLNGGNAPVSTGGGDLGYLNVDGSVPAYQYQAHASYWAMRMLTNDWAISGDATPHHLVSTTIGGVSSALLAAYSDYRPDGILSLVVINKNPTASYATNLNLAPFVPNATANEWVYNSTNYQWVTTGAPPYHAAPDTAPTTLTATGVSNSFPITFGPYSINVLQFTNSGVPTNTPTNTPTITQTPTVTSTPNYGPATLVDDFEDLSRDQTSPSRTNLWNGSWNVSKDAGSALTVTYGVPGAGGTSHAVSVAGNEGTGGYTNYQSALSSGYPPTAYDLAADGVVGLQFWIYGDGKTYRVMVDSAAVTAYDYYGINVTPPAGVWTFYQVPFSSMTRQGWGGQATLPTTFPGDDANGIQVATQSTGAFSYQLDQIAFYTAAGATPSATPTATKTRTVTPTVTATGTPTLSPTVTLSPTWTLSPTITQTPVFSYTPTDTPTPLNTATFTLTTTPTKTQTFTLTPTSSPSQTPTVTLTPSPSQTPNSSVFIPYPNPSNGQSPVSFYYNVTDVETSVSLKIFTVASRKIFEDSTLSTSIGQHSYGLDWAARGLEPANGLFYFLIEFRDNGQVSHKIMKVLVIR